MNSCIFTKALLPRIARIEKRWYNNKKCNYSEDVIHTLSDEVCLPVWVWVMVCPHGYKISEYTHSLKQNILAGHFVHEAVTSYESICANCTLGASSHVQFAHMLSHLLNSYQKIYCEVDKDGYSIESKRIKRKNRIKKKRFCGSYWYSA